MSLGVIRFPEVSSGVLKCHKVSSGVFISPRVTLVSSGIIRCPQVSSGIRCTQVPLVILRVTQGHLGVLIFPLISLSALTCPHVSLDVHVSEMKYFHYCAATINVCMNLKCLMI